MDFEIGSNQIPLFEASLTWWLKNAVMKIMVENLTTSRAISGFKTVFLRRKVTEITEIQSSSGTLELCKKGLRFS